MDSRKPALGALGAQCPQALLALLARTLAQYKVAEAPRLQLQALQALAAITMGVLALGALPP